jgi:hypothetical protein
MKNSLKFGREPKELLVYFVSIGGVVRVPVAIGTKRDAIPDTVTLFCSQDVMHVKEASEMTLSVASRALAAAATPAPHGRPNARIPPDS